MLQPPLAPPATAADRVGLGWRPSLAAGLQAHAGQIDVLEVIADDWLSRSPTEIRALASLARQTPVVLHGVGLGLASAWPVDETHLAQLARLIERVAPSAWSEHLAFVRAGGLAIGHLAAPPRTPATLAGTLRNLQRIHAVVGSLPWLENIATLIAPPASPLDEASWLHQLVAHTEAPLLLDLHNLYANAINQGDDPEARLLALPLGRVQCVHIAGGCWSQPAGAEQRRWLDSHRHDTPHAVLELLTTLRAHTRQRLTVILERDGNYPAMPVLLAQLDDIRAALARGRQAAASATLTPPAASPLPMLTPLAQQAAQRLEHLLARLYTGQLDADTFLRQPLTLALAHGCSMSDAQRLAQIDADGLRHAVHSYAAKRAAYPQVAVQH